MYEFTPYANRMPNDVKINKIDAYGSGDVIIDSLDRNVWWGYIN